MTKKELILLTARELFQKNGYETTSIQQIIEASNVSKGCFYHHFSSKEHLFDILSEEIVAPLLSSIHDILSDTSCSFQDQILAIFDEKTKFYLHQFEIIKPIFTDVTHISLQFKARLVMKRLLKPMLDDIRTRNEKERVLKPEAITLLFGMHEMLFEYIIPDISLPSELQSYFDLQRQIANSLFQ